MSCWKAGRQKEFLLLAEALHFVPVSALELGPALPI